MPKSNYLNTSPILGDRVYLHPSCQVIGEVTLGDDSSVENQSGTAHDILRNIL
jgi:carbonic anhydrase/acetyltransferase-like protein (isoleucine patch superfamily)